jgi:hypothetical protein
MHYWALLGLLRTWNSCSQVVESVFIDRIDIIYIVSHLWMFVTDSFSARRNSTSHCLKCSHYTMPFWWPPMHVQENILFCCPASKINQGRNADFSVDFDKYRKCCKALWATLILYTPFQKYLYIKNPCIKIFSRVSSCYIRWKFSSSGMWHCIVGCTALDILKDLTKCW